MVCAWKEVPRTRQPSLLPPAAPVPPTGASFWGAVGGGHLGSRVVAWLVCCCCCCLMCQVAIGLIHCKMFDPSGNSKTRQTPLCVVQWRNRDWACKLALAARCMFIGSARAVEIRTAGFV